MNDKGHGFPRGVYALLDDSLAPVASFVERVGDVVAAGAPVVQLRFKRTADVEALQVARACVARAGSQVAVIINDRVDLALRAGAAGVHLGDDDLPCAVARRIAPALLVGVTCREARAVEAAAAAGATYAGVGPVWPSTTKPLATPTLGVEGLAAICSRQRLPVVAISGVSLERLPALAGAGAHGAAVGSAWLSNGTPRAALRQLVAAFELPQKVG